ncbi:MAG: HD domain-containing phosphohydrolase [Planctomycetota bacterium]
MRLARLFEVEDAVVSSLQLEVVLKRILETANTLMEVDASSIRLLDEEEKRLEFAASVGFHANVSFKAYLKVGESVVGRAVKERRPFPVSDIMRSTYKNRTFAIRHGLRSLLSIPLTVKDKILGGLTVYSRRRHVYADEEVRLLLAIGNLAAMAIENSTLLKDTLNTLISLNAAIEAKDPYTRGHSERVAVYARDTALAMEFPTHRVAMLEQVAVLHDIGKVAVPDSILNKPGKLTPAEWTVIRRHSAVGETILQPIKTLKEGAHIIRHHHEWWNGKGYPDGIARERIPLESRLITIADAYDTMTTKRAYNVPRSPEKAFAELRACAGTQFDPAVVRVFCRVITDSRKHGI